MYSLFFLMLFAPTVYQPIKAVLLVVIIALVIFKILLINKGNTNLHPRVLFWTWLTTCTGAIFILIGVYKGYSGALNLLTVYFIWPWVYTLFASGFTREMLDKIVRVLVYGSLAIELYILSFILTQTGKLPSWFFIELDLHQIMYMNQGVPQFSLPSLATLIFSLSFIVAALVLWDKKENHPVSRKILWIVFVLGLLVVLMSGRRALMITVATSFLFTLIFRVFLPKEKRKSSRKNIVSIIFGSVFVSIIVFIYLQNNNYLTLSSMIYDFKSGFAFSSDESAMARASQYKALMDGWADSPFIGQGFGGQAGDVVRNANNWQYELQYNLLLFSTGIVGTFVYLASVLWVFLTNIRIIRSGDKLAYFSIPILVGTLSFLISNATNPYLGKYDHMWTLFLPIFVANIWLVQNKKFKKAIKQESVVLS